MKFEEYIKDKKHLFIVGISKNLRPTMVIDGKEVERVEIADYYWGCEYKIYDKYWCKRFGVDEDCFHLLHWSAKKINNQIMKRKQTVMGV